MVQLGHCARCRTHSSEVWSRKDVCPVCGSPMEHVVEEMGGIEWVPRTFNVLGIGSITVAIVLIFYYLMSASTNDTLLTACIVLFGGGGLLFTASLLSQMYLTDQAIKRVEERGPRRVPLALRDGREVRKMVQRSGPKPLQGRKAPPAQTPYLPRNKLGKKIIIKR